MWRAARHVAPFVLWIVLMFGLGEPAGWKYAVRAGASMVLLLALRPWRYYSGPAIGDLAWGVPAGVAVFIAWIGMETAYGGFLPGLQDFYLRWMVLPIGEYPPLPEGSPFAPDTCGWALSLTRLAGSAFVIAVIEEFFWRSFLYRWLVRKDFLSVGIGEFHPQAFIIATVLFGLEHHRWLAGILAGLVYGGLMIRRRSIWAPVIAHVVTNFLLGVYVLQTGSYNFW